MLYLLFTRVNCIHPFLCFIFLQYKPITHTISFVFSWPFMVFIKYTTMYKVHMHAAAIRKLSHGCVYVREMILLLMDYLPIHKIVCSR